VPVLRYRGTPDDAEGTRIQNLGPTASPRGPGGGVGPGRVGNFIVTGHRTSHTAPFRDLPALRDGDRIRVRTGPTVFVYRVTATRSTSFRSARSLAEQSAAVPGRPGADPVRPMITLSTCATPEDHAVGNYWADRFGNPEHRIDKVGVLVATLPAA
jgi:sortase A